MRNNRRRSSHISSDLSLLTPRALVVVVCVHILSDSRADYSRRACKANHRDGEHAASSAFRFDLCLDRAWL